jgi:hypothetical protein
MTSAGPNASRSGLVETFHADLDCKVGLVSSTIQLEEEAVFNIVVDIVGDNCATGPIVVIRAVTAESLATWYNIGQAFFKQCAVDSQLRLFLFFGTMELGGVSGRLDGGWSATPLQWILQY